MAKKFPHNRLKKHRVYTVFEAAEALGCHRQTVIRWIGNGLQADQSCKPWLIEGRVLKEYLGARMTARKCKLALDHFYCLGCKSPQPADGKIADYHQQTPQNGRLSALCPCCGALMHKVIRRADLEAIRAKINVTIQKADPRIVSLSAPHSNVIFTNEAEPHVKTQQR